MLVRAERVLCCVSSNCVQCGEPNCIKPADRLTSGTFRQVWRRSQARLSTKQHRVCEPSALAKRRAIGPAQPARPCLERRGLPGREGPECRRHRRDYHGEEYVIEVVRDNHTGTSLLDLPTNYRIERDQPDFIATRPLVITLYPLSSVQLMVKPTAAVWDRVLPT